MKTIPPATIRRLREKILGFYRLHGRSLPFRKTTDPYKIAVAEIMLQQTQVDRVVPKYLAWIKKWPDWKSLSRATNKELLLMWSGLGYNRRALHLGNMARVIMSKHRGRLPTDQDALQHLPGIGPYSARAILIFAFNRPLITIDTNIRRVILHEFELPSSTPMEDIERIAWQVLPRGDSRDWHNALMDYSRLILPARIKDIPALSRQSPFEGSIRQIRGEIIRQLTARQTASVAQVAKKLERTTADVLKAATAMEKEDIISIGKGVIRLA